MPLPINLEQQAIFPPAIERNLSVIAPAITTFGSKNFYGLSVDEVIEELKKDTPTPEENPHTISSFLISPNEYVQPPRSLRGILRSKNIEILKPRAPSLQEETILEEIADKDLWRKLGIKIIIVDNPLSLSTPPTSNGFYKREMAEEVGSNWINAAYDGDLYHSFIYLFVPPCLSNQECSWEDKPPIEYNPLIGGELAEQMNFQDLFKAVVLHEEGHAIEDYFLKQEAQTEEDYKDLEKNTNRFKGYRNPVISRYARLAGYRNIEEYGQLTSNIRTQRGDIIYYIHPEEPYVLYIKSTKSQPSWTIGIPLEGLINNRVLRLQPFTEEEIRRTSPRTIFGNITESFADKWMLWRLGETHRLTSQEVNLFESLYKEILDENSSTKLRVARLQIRLY